MKNVPVGISAAVFVLASAWANAGAGGIKKLNVTHDDLEKVFEAHCHRMHMHASKECIEEHISEYYNNTGSSPSPKTFSNGKSLQPIDEKLSPNSSKLDFF